MDLSGSSTTPVASPDPAPETGATSRGPRSPLAGLLAAMRPKQWVKNFFCFPGLVFSGQLFEPAAQLEAFAGFLSFCAGSSAVYLANDLVDRDRDRFNPRTRHRPIASGEVSTGLACAAALGLLAVALGVAAWLGLPCVIVLSAYLVMNAFYSTRLKHKAIADVMCIALGFVFRVIFGVYAVQVLPTPWIIVCMFFLALFLGFAKRRSEFLAGAETREHSRPVLGRYSGLLLDILLGMSATMTIMGYSLFTVASSRNPTLIVTVLPVAFCVMHYMHRVIVDGKGEQPEAILISDRSMWIGIATWMAMCIAILYGDLHLFEEQGGWHRKPAEVRQ